MKRSTPHRLPLIQSQPEFLAFLLWYARQQHWHNTAEAATLEAVAAATLAAEEATFRPHRTLRPRSIRRATQPARQLRSHISRNKIQSLRLL